MRKEDQGLTWRIFLSGNKEVKVEGHKMDIISEH